MKLSPEPIKKPTWTVESFQNVVWFALVGNRIVVMDKSDVLKVARESWHSRRQHYYLNYGTLYPVDMYKVTESDDQAVDDLLNLALESSDLFMTVETIVLSDVVFVVKLTDLPPFCHRTPFDFKTLETAYKSLRSLTND